MKKHRFSHNVFQVYFYLRRSPDQGEESVVVVLLVLVGGTIFHFPMYSFFGVWKGKTLSQKECEKAKTLSQKECEKAKTLSQRGCEKAKTLFSKGV